MPAIGSVLVDTSLVVDCFRKSSTLQDRFDQAGDVMLCPTVLGELLFGALKSKRPELLLSQVREFQSTCALIFPDERTALQYGLIKLQLLVTGQPIPENDIWIAAIAKQHKLPLATRDRHFSFVAGLQVLAW